jgi:hypothetical protein
MPQKAARKDARPQRGAKLAGVVTMERPAGGRAEAIPSGTRLVVSIADIVLRELPESGARSEIQVDIGTRTTAQNGGAVGSTWSSGVLYYVERGSHLNLADVVLFDGVVHQHLSFDIQIVERESPRMGPDNAAALAESAAEAAASLASAAGPLADALELFPEMMGGILRLGGDDQVLRYSVSSFTREVERPAERACWLIEGTYRIEKRATAGTGEPSAIVSLDVCRVV